MIPTADFVCCDLLPLSNAFDTHYYSCDCCLVSSLMLCSGGNHYVLLFLPGQCRADSPEKTPKRATCQTEGPHNRLEGGLRALSLSLHRNEDNMVRGHIELISTVTSTSEGLDQAVNMSSVFLQCQQ